VNLEEVGHEVVVEYILHRTPFRSKATVASAVGILRGMGEYLLRAGVWRQNPLRWIRGPRIDPRGRLPRRIGRGHLEAIWEAAGKLRGYQRAQGVAVLSLLYGTGLRRGELERLNVGDWRREEGVLVLDGRKTGRERSVPVSGGMWRCVEAYLPQRQNLLERARRPEEEALLVNRRGRRLSVEAITKLVHRLARVAGVPRVSLHQFRHTCASDLIENGASLSEVQQMLTGRRVTA